MSQFLSFCPKFKTSWNHNENFLVSFKTYGLNLIQLNLRLFKDLRKAWFEIQWPQKAFGHLKGQFTKEPVWHFFILSSVLNKNKIWCSVFTIKVKLTYFMDKNSYNIPQNIFSLFFTALSSLHYITKHQISWHLQTNGAFLTIFAMFKQMVQRSQV